jgi:hypothetical protein
MVSGTDEDKNYTINDERDITHSTSIMVSGDGQNDLSSMDVAKNNNLHT